MNEPSTQASTKTSSPADQRESLDHSERQANREQPGSYKPEATADKVVEIEPIDQDRSDAAIKGIDPKR